MFTPDFGCNLTCSYLRLGEANVTQRCCNPRCRFSTSVFGLGLQSEQTDSYEKDEVNF